MRRLNLAILENIEGFHRVTFVSNFDVNVEIGGHFGDQEHIIRDCNSVKACFYTLDSCTSCIFVCYRLAGTSGNICKLREAVADEDVTRIIAVLTAFTLLPHMERQMGQNSMLLHTWHGTQSATRWHDVQSGNAFTTSILKEEFVGGGSGFGEWIEFFLLLMRARKPPICETRGVVSGSSVCPVEC